MLMYISLAIWGLLALVLLLTIGRCFRLVPTQRAFIVERLGKYQQTLGPGFHLLLPFFDRVAFVRDLREETIDVPPQECFTKDNVKVEVDGVLYISVKNAVNAAYGITDYRWAAMQLAQTTTRSVIGTLELDRTFEERDAINSRVVSVLNEVSEAWGIRLHRYEVKNIVVPNTVRKSMEKQMSAERERRALLARSEGDRQSRINMSEGQKMELINRSEGERQRRVNTAEGRAQEILAIAKATAQSIEKIALAVSLPSGQEAVQLRLGEQYLSQIGKLARPDKRVILPTDLSNLDSMLSAVGLNLAIAEPGNGTTTQMPHAPIAVAPQMAAPRTQVAAPSLAVSPSPTVSPGPAAPLPPPRQNTTKPDPLI